MSKENKAVKTVSLIIIVTFLGKILALFRDIFLARIYGSGIETNAFLTASRIPRVLFDAIFACAITSSFIPIFNKVLKKEGKDKAYEYSDVFISAISIFMLVLMFLSFIFSKNIVLFFADGFNKETLALCNNLLIILLPTMLATGIAFSIVGILQSMEIFIIPASISLVFNIIIIGYYFTFNSFFGIYGLAVTYLIGWIMQVLIQVPSLRKVGYSFKFKPYFNYPYLKETVVLMLPVMISTWVQPFNIMINAKYASRLYNGSAVSYIEFSNNLYTMIVGVLVLSIMNFVFPTISKLINENKEKEFNLVVKNTITFTMFFVIPLMFGVMSLSNEAINLIYGGKKFDINSVKITSQALYYFSIGMIGYSLQNILSRVYFAKEKPMIPMIGAIISIIINYGLCEILIKPFEVKGLALASSIALSVNAMVLLIPMFIEDRKNVKKIFDFKFFSSMIKIFCASLIMYFSINYGKLILKMENVGFIKLLVNILILFVFGVVEYFICCFIFKVEEIKEIKRIVTKRNKEGKND